MIAIALLPLGVMRPGIVTDVRPVLEDVFQASTSVLDAPVDVRPFYDAKRSQYNSTTILRYVKEHLVQDGALHTRRKRTRAILCITPYDLFIPVLTYVFGEAELNGGIAVASYFRLQNEIYGLPPDHPLLVDRFRKEAVHELGHALGLVHCRLQECVMHTSTYVEDIDLKGQNFCSECRAILESGIAGQR